jgi:hypothetical protein
MLNAFERKMYGKSIDPRWITDSGETGIIKKCKVYVRKWR